MKKGIIVTLLLASSCMVGPNYTPPVTMMPQNFVETPPPECAEPVCDGVFFEWWKRFGDETLNELLFLTARQNFDVRIATARICQARAQFLTQTANLFPQFSFDGQAARFRSSRNIFASAANFGILFQNFFLAGFDVAWQIDIFGGLRRARRAALFAAESAEESARNTQILALSEVAMQYTLIRALQQKIILSRAIVEADLEEIATVSDKLKAGLASELQLEAINAVLAQDSANVEFLESLLLKGIYSLGTLVGVPPESLICKFVTVLPIPRGGNFIPAGLPSQLLCRRPDIRAAERNLASATEQIGVAVASLFPVFSLTSANLFQSRLTSSNFGFASNHFKDLFRSQSQTWSFGLATFWPLIDFGRRIGDIRLNNCVQQEALVNYEKTVVNALGEVEGSLAAYFQEEKRESFLQAQVDANYKSLLLMQDQFQAGFVSSTEVTEAKRLLLNSQNLLADSSQALTTNLIAVYKALGGEWECFYTP